MIVFAARHRLQESTKKMPDWLVEVRDKLDADFVSTPTLTGISQSVGRNPCHVARVFRVWFKMSVGEYVRRLKIGLAQKLLCETDAPLKSIARASGFSDKSHLANAFRNHVGMSPGQFREQNRS